MKAIKWMIGLVLALFSICLYAQNDNAQSPQSDSEVDNVNEAQRAGTADTPGAEEAAEAANTDAGNETDSASQASDAAIVPQTTSSQSGSPALLSGKNGSERDGTNNVQRATFNMVGSPVENINLGDDQTVDADSELQDRQDRTQEKQTSAQIRGDDIPSESSEMNDNTRRENNAISDQNASSENSKKSHGADNKKSDKQKKRKDKG